jgi:hypothetical protein
LRDQLNEFESELNGAPLSCDPFFDFIDMHAV